MLDSLYIAATGLASQQTQLDVVSNNLANVNTTGFKKSRVMFEDLMYQNVIASNGAAATQADVARLQGSGSGVAMTERVFKTGDLKQTENPLDIAITGEGFYEVQRANGELAYTRLGIFKLNDAGELTTSEGSRLNTAIAVPSDTTELLVNKAGLVSALVGDGSELIELGQLELAGFANPGALEPLGNGLYGANSVAGAVEYAVPGESGFGELSQGFTEASNVDFVEELMSLVATQRAYEVNAKVIQAADEMLGIINNLRR